jgi:hypothetical protein
MQQRAPTPQLVEFVDLRLDDKGVWHAVHEKSGTTIEADNWERLVNRAVAVRVREGLGFGRADS